MPRGPARSRLRAGLALLASVLASAPGAWAPGTATGPAAAAARPGPLCFATDPLSFVAVLEVIGRATTSVRLLGYLRGINPPFPTVPLAGAARLRDDGDLDFAVLSGGLNAPTEIYVRGRLNAPDFDSGSGTVLLDNPFLVVAPTAVDFLAAPCPTFTGDPP